jgi:hypothetical protein
MSALAIPLMVSPFHEAECDYAIILYQLAQAGCPMGFRTFLLHVVQAAQADRHSCMNFSSAGLDCAERVDPIDRQGNWLPPSARLREKVVKSMTCHRP